MAFPETVNVNGSDWSRESCSDGWVYRVTGITNPHVTIHDEKEGDFYGWLRRGGFHLRYSGAGKLWEYNRGEPDGFATQSGLKTTNKGAEEPQANQLAKDFWAAIKSL